MNLGFRASTLVKRLFPAPHLSDIAKAFTGWSPRLGSASPPTPSTTTRSKTSTSSQSTHLPWAHAQGTRTGAAWPVHTQAWSSHAGPPHGTQRRSRYPPPQTRSRLPMSLSLATRASFQCTPAWGTYRLCEVFPTAPAPCHGPQSGGLSPSLSHGLAYGPSGEDHMCPEKHVCSAAGSRVFQSLGVSGRSKVLPKSPASCGPSGCRRRCRKWGAERLPRADCGSLPRTRFCFVHFRALLLGAQVFIIVMPSWCIGLFILMKCPALSLITLS